MLKIKFELIETNLSSYHNTYYSTSYILGDAEYKFINSDFLGYIFKQMAEEIIKEAVKEQLEKLKQLNKLC